MRLLRQHQSFETSIVRVRVMVFEGWNIKCIVADEKKSKRILIENRFGFDWLTIGIQDARRGVSLIVIPFFNSC